ncbi:exo-beta-1,4-galactosidase [Mucilaginibacter paludis]|uniref:beta-galactosidase n=1 Tax=Mucilaginibacter paludis DSM 18603 TaxID=714943 RepID=H1Y0W5_9SPHI|nr:sugar-binding domain-containing protein [Mucilaginibacter paludis]EHQ29190.1 glycoside hydrolase family 2 sugar binding [Mucilaginibacter paludis DSM 18603]
MKSVTKSFALSLLPAAFVTILLSAFVSNDHQIPLAGNWRFKIDSLDKGITEKWFSKQLDDHIHLPGSMAENLKGNDITLKTKWTGSIYDSSWYYNPRMAKYRQPGNIKIPFWLTPAKHYTGAAWYQKDVSIPQSWKGQRILLNLERAHTETRVWVDDKEVGMQNTMVVAQVFDLTPFISPGKHTITLRIDNRIKEINVGQDSHSLTDHTQGNWNGVVGKMELIAGANTWFDDIQVYPDLKQKTAHIKLHLKSNQSVNAKIVLSAVSFNTQQALKVAPVTKSIQLKNGETDLDMDLPMGDKMLTWDEFNPALYKLTAQLTTTKGQADEKQIQFGMREFKAVDKHFEINGRPVFLRGTVNNCEFPLTGYANMDVGAWERIFNICKANGLNHIRFHSWCPPEAAFIAADKVGFYLHVEGPSWANHGTSIGDKKPIDQFIYDETDRMDKAYGNYASFCMMAYGNEPRGRQVEYLTKFVDYWKAKDSRHLYTGASVGGSWPVIPNNEYMVRAGNNARGLTWNRQPESVSNYDEDKNFKVPFVVHEMGQWCVYPDFKEIKKYTGVYRAKNFELFQEDLADRGMGDQAEQFLMASGKLQALCYKNEIEKALRTPGYGGFQLLSLNDYPGQGTALIGLLNAFWDEKGYITAKEFARFCNAVVPLSRIPKFVYTNNEVFKADAELFNYSAAELANKTVSWKITNSKGLVLTKGAFTAKNYAIGSCIPVGAISYPLSDVKEASKLNLEIAVEGTSYVNDWNFWVYPEKLPEVKNTGVYYCTTLDKQAEDVLNSGGKVFLNAAGKVVKGKEVIQSLTPVFWNTSWFKMRPPHTLGILCDEANPAFTNFPTSYHTDLQWWDVLNKAQVMILEDFPKGFKPLIQPIDTWFLNRRLAFLFEAKVGKGKLIVSSLDLSADVDSTRPASRQLYYSLQNYMQSAQFNPSSAVDLSVIKDVFETGSKEKFTTYTKDSPDELKPKAQKKP